MRNFIILFMALSMSAFTFGQEQGQWSFGVGHSFVNLAGTNDAEPVAANAGYFVMDGLMLSLEFQMMTDSSDDIEDGETNWGVGARYYIGEDGLWAGMMMRNNEYYDVEEGEDVSGMDFHLAVGCSKALGFDDKLWFEPSLGMAMPADSDAMHLGLAMGFRFTF